MKIGKPKLSAELMLSVNQKLCIPTPANRVVCIYMFLVIKLPCQSIILKLVFSMSDVAAEGNLFSLVFDNHPATTIHQIKS